jgi:integrase
VREPLAQLDEGVPTGHRHADYVIPRAARELRRSFVSVLSDADIPVEEISQLVGHSGTTVTELVYRHQLRPMIQTGATDRLFRPGGVRADDLIPS